MVDEKSRAREGGPKIIGTGLPRTGTTSLCVALETLGFAPCHHFRGMIAENKFPYRNARLWAKAARIEDKDTRQDLLHHLLEGCPAAVDYPTSCFVDDLIEMYPDAKFIHAERTSPEAWQKSYNQTVGRLWNDPLMWYGGYLIPMIRFAVVPVTGAMDDRCERVFGKRIYSLGDEQIELYHRHNAFVHRVYPKEKLFDLDPKLGYEPLCEFLNVPVPTDERGNKLEYPHVNDSASMNRGLNMGITMGFALWGVVIAGAYFALRRVAYVVL